MRRILGKVGYSQEQPWPLHSLAESYVVEGGIIAQKKTARISRAVLKKFSWKRRKLRNGDFLRQIHVLNCVQQLHAFRHRPLERFAAADQSRAAGALIDDCRSHRFFEVVGS